MGASAAARAAPPTPSVHAELLPLAVLRESPLNHRRTWGDMDELTKSVRAQGVLQPVLARPVEGGFELVFGHRRFRAAKSAGLDAIPALVREMSDVDVVEAQVVENVQRVDVHPLEEAEGYEQLLAQKERPLTVEDLAAKVGKSKAYVYGRLKLLALTPPARKAFYAGEMTASVALLVARVPATLQKEALADVIRSYDPGEPMGFRQALDIIQRRFMLNLKEASFDRADEGLVPAAGACGTCPKRTGANPDLFGDVGSADVCTDPGCYREKLDAWWTRQAAAMRAAGGQVLDAKESKEVFDTHNFGTHVRYGSPYVGLDTHHPSDPKGRTYGKLLGKRVAEAAVLAQAPNGETVQLLPKKALPKLLKAAGHDFKGERSTQAGGMTPEELEAYRRNQEKAAITTAVHDRARALIGDALDVQPLSREFWEAVADVLVAASDPDLEDVVVRRVLGDVNKPLESFGKKRKSFTDDQLRAVILEALCVMRLHAYGGSRKPFERMAGWARVDLKAVEKQVKADRAAAAKEPKKGKGARS